ncbi:MAG: AAA family ATPase, partial [Bacteroidales bacterium]|nr:AAA family ATPase [Bacteroidales bacterium]
MTPLAEQLRPTSLDNYIGQQHLVGKGAILRNAIETGNIPSMILWGPPGIGKTAIMEQIAQELGVGLVSYSMTHHTRQSALGLPFIETKNYGGKEYSVSEYTMSEIIASVYDM